MDSLDHDHSLHTKQHAGDEKLFVTFYEHYVPDAVKSADEGRPIFKDAVFCRIITPGDRDNIIDRELRDSDKIRFPKAWDAFQKGSSEIGDGTRLEEWPIMSKSMVEELRYLGFRTVEQIAEAPENALNKVTGLRMWQERAKAYLDFAKGSAPIEKLAKDNEDLRNQLAAMQEQVNQLAALKATSPEPQKQIATPEAPVTKK